MDRPIPTYYVHEETTAGSLYFWPIPAVRQSHMDLGYHREITWLDDRGDVAAERGGYLITETRTETLTATWRESPTISHYRRKSEDELSPVARMLVSRDAGPREFPERIERSEWEGRCEWGPDSDCTDCMWHQVRGGIYERVMGEPAVRQHEYDLSGLEELDLTEPDPAPDREWILASPSLAAFYPQPAHHQFPGQLSGMFGDIAEAVKAAAGELGIPVEVKVYGNIRDISVSASIVWDQDLPYREVPGRSRKAREENAKRRRSSRIAQSWYRSVKPSDLVAGATKAEALAKRDAIVARYVAELIPPHMVACEKCRGLGYIR